MKFTPNEVAAAYLWDRSQQYEPQSAALADAAVAILKGEHEERYRAGDFDDEDVTGWIGRRRRGPPPQPTSTPRRGK